MKRRRIPAVMAIVLIFIGISAFISDVDPFSALLSKLEVYNKNNQQEKVHLHLDKPYYAIGEDIWFKAYVLNTVTSAPSQISNTLYVDLIDELDSVKRQIIIPLSFGMGWGDFSLKTPLSAGNYRIRAYTRWMMNAGPEFFYDKTIKIGNSVSITAADKQKNIKTVPVRLAPAKVDVQFFPEGGSLVENIPSHIAVKAVGSDGLGKNISILIRDQNGTELTTLETKHLGMGSFILNPVPGKVYTAAATFSDGSKKEFPLPKALPEGYVLAVNNSDSSKVAVKIMLSNSLLGKGELKLIAQHNNNVIYSIKANSERQVIAASFSKEQLRSGILRLTLFAPDNKPAAERLIFVNHLSDKLVLKPEKIPVVSKPAERVVTNFSVSHGGKPTPGSFSVAINNISKIEPDELNESNIFTDLLLKSDLIGYIEKPNYYFLNKDQESQSNLDLLMLTQGWRRFIWQDFLEDKQVPLKFQPEKLLTISGKVTTVGGKPVAHGKVTLLSPSSKFFVVDTVTDANGNFAFKEMFFGDSTKFVVKAQTQNNKSNVNIKMDSRTRQLVNRNPNTGDIEVNVNEAISAYLTKNDNYFNELKRLGLLGNAINLQTVDIVAEKKKVTESANFNGPGNADYIFTANEDELETKVDLRQALIGRVGGLEFALDSGGQQFAFLRKAQTSVNPNAPVKIILDGIEFGSDIRDIMMSEIESIEVLSNASLSFLYGTSSGVIIITSKKGKPDSQNMDATPGILPYNPNGYYTPRQFYMPKYEPNKTSGLADYRTTIFWKPNVITDKDGNADFEYFNANEPGTYRVVIEGIDAFGNLGRKVYTCTVK